MPSVLGTYGKNFQLFAHCKFFQRTSSSVDEKVVDLQMSGNTYFCVISNSGRHPLSSFIAE